MLKSNLTSPDPIFLHKALQKIKDNKIDNVIIEASSHGLDQKRIDSLNLNAGIFTNFSQDHLDYHKTMSSYLNAKLRLFKEILPHKKSIITDTSIKEFSKLKQNYSCRAIFQAAIVLEQEFLKPKITNYCLR